MVEGHHNSNSSSSSHSSSHQLSESCNLSKPNDMMGFIANTISGLETRLAQTMETRLTQVTDVLQAQLSQTLSQVISQAFSQVNIPPQAAPLTSAQAPHVWGSKTRNIHPIGLRFVPAWSGR
ncbi:hypothetical protein Taro_014398 [Colocasia esculenta]|uniref:Uncharacterized protein n=1 Tax=Colocasia esculenta TaxID=4460 RepID=A0A843UES4_COLES|nr:hypothetical protein [Colocasia esculenta]